jgi:glycine cleavage system H protein
VTSIQHWVTQSVDRVGPDHIGPSNHNRGDATMTAIPDDLRYSEDHLWVRPGGDQTVVRVGITDFAQDSLGDVVDVTLPDPGAGISAEQACGEIESTKSLSDLVAPVTGTVRTRNEALGDSPEQINEDPYGDGWLIEVAVDPATRDEQLQALMSPSAYEDLAGES